MVTLATLVHRNAEYGNWCATPPASASSRPPSQLSENAKDGGKK